MNYLEFFYKRFVLLYQLLYCPHIDYDHLHFLFYYLNFQKVITKYNASWLLYFISRRRNSKIYSPSSSLSVNFCYRAIGRNTQRNIGQSLLRQWQQHHIHAAKCFPKTTSWVSEYFLLFIIIPSKPVGTEPPLEFAGPGAKVDIIGNI